MNENKRRRTIQNVGLVTMQPFNKGSLDAKTWKRSLSHQLFVNTMFIKTYLSHQCREKLVAKREFGVNSRPFASQVLLNSVIVYFLSRSGEISVEVIDRRWCRRLEVPWQLEFNFSNKVQRNSWKNHWRARFGFRSVMKILTNGSFWSQRKRWSTTGFVMFNLYLVKVFSSICDNNKPVYSLWKEWSHV